MKYFLLTAFFLGTVSLLSQAHAMEDANHGNNNVRRPAPQVDAEGPMIEAIKALVKRQSDTGETVLASFSPASNVLAVKLENGIGFKYLPVLPKDDEEVTSTDKK